jgi:ornithine cyclodeaminase/alanine dehydrogenase-like protein (mu-crystallin family)
MRLVGAEELRALIPMRAAIDALERAFSTEDPSGTPPRSHVGTTAGTLLVMPAAGDAGVGVKLVTITPANPQDGLALIQAVYVLFDPKTQAPVAVIEGAALTALRTAAVSALATEWLARPDAGRLVIFGSGVQARAHVEAMCEVRPVGSVTVVSRNDTHAAIFADEIREEGLHVRVGTPADVETADLICTCTTSETPLFDGRKLAPGVHINAVGAYQPETRELDTATVVRARVVVENRVAALLEAGDLLIPIAEGAIGPDHLVADLGELVGGAVVRASEEDVTVFKSVGLAFEDLVVAGAILDAI